MVKIAVFNQKGGTAKTTSVFNIAGILAKEYKKKVLVVDGDPQANSSKALLLENMNIYRENNHREFFDDNPTIVEVLEGKCSVDDAIYKASIKIRDRYDGKWRGIDVLPTKRSMSAVEMKSDYDIKTIIDSIRRNKRRAYNYDFVLCDCPPYLSDFTINILASCDYVLVPASTDMDSLDGFSELVDTINALHDKDINTHLEILGVYLTMIKPNESFDRYVYSECKEYIGDKFLDMPIRRDTSAKQASTIGVPLCWYKQTSNAAKDYRVLTKSILSRLNMLPDEEKEDLEIGVKEFVEKYGLDG